MSAEFRSKDFQRDEPSTWIPAFIQYINDVRKYEDLVVQLQEAQWKVAGLQVEHIEPPEGPFLTDTHREALRYRVSKEKKSDVQLDNPPFSQSALSNIKVALEETFVREAIGEKVESCYEKLRKLLDPAGKEIPVRGPDSGAACEQKILKQVKKVAPITQHQNPDKDEIFFVPFEPTAPESSRAERTKYNGPLLLHYMGWTLNPGILKVVEELPFLGSHSETHDYNSAKKERVIEGITNAYNRARAAEFAYEALVKLFKTIGRMEEYGVQASSA